MLDPSASSACLPSLRVGSPHKIQSFTHAGASTVRLPTCSPPGHGISKAKRRSSTRNRPRSFVHAGDGSSYETGLPALSLEGMISTEVASTRGSLTQPSSSRSTSPATKGSTNTRASVGDENMGAQQCRPMPPKRMNLDRALVDVGNIHPSGTPLADRNISHTSKPSSSWHAAPTRAKPRRGSHIDHCSPAARVVSDISPSSTHPGVAATDKCATARKKMPAAFDLAQPHALNGRDVHADPNQQLGRRRRRSASLTRDKSHNTPTSLGTTSDGNTSREDQRSFDSEHDNSSNYDNDGESLPPLPPAGSPPSMPLPASPRRGTMNPISPFAPFKSPKGASLQYNPAPSYTPGAPLPLVSLLEPAPAGTAAAAAAAASDLLVSVQSKAGATVPLAPWSTPSPSSTSGSARSRGRCSSSNSSSSHTPASATTTIPDEDDDDISGNFSGMENHHCHHDDADDEASCQSSSHWSLGSSSSSFSSGSFFSPELVAQLQKHKLYDHVCLRTLRLANVGSLEELSQVPVIDLMAGGFNKIQARKLSDIATAGGALPDTAIMGRHRSDKKAARKALLLSAVEKDGHQITQGNDSKHRSSGTAIAITNETPPSRQLSLGAPAVLAGVTTSKHRKRQTKQRRARKKQEEDITSDEAASSQQNVFVVASTPVAKKTNQVVNQQPRLHKSSSADDVLVSSSMNNKNSISLISTSSSGGSPDHSFASPSSRALLSSSKSHQLEGKASAVQHASYNWTNGWRQTHFGSWPVALGKTPHRSRSADDALGSSSESAAAVSSPRKNGDGCSWWQRGGAQTKGFGTHRDGYSNTPRLCASPLRTFEVSPKTRMARDGSEVRGEDGEDEDGAVSDASEVFCDKDAPGEAASTPTSRRGERRGESFAVSPGYAAAAAAASPSHSSASFKWFTRSRAFVSNCYRFGTCRSRTAVQSSVKQSPTPLQTPPTTTPPPRNRIVNND